MEASCSGRQAGQHCPCHQRSVALLRPAGLLPAVSRPAPLVANSQLLRDQRHGLLSAKHKEARIMQTHALPAVGEVGDVEEVAGVRVVIDEDSKPAVEYLVKWKDGEEHTWEPPANLADNLLRDFEERWWKHCKEGDEEAMRKLLASSGRVLAHVVDENRRSALHFVAAIGNLVCTKLLCDAGADLNLSDKDGVHKPCESHLAEWGDLLTRPGYTPLHMAVGYSHMPVAAALLEAGADPELEDRQGRNVVMLVESIRDSMPVNAALVSRRMALEQVSSLLSDCLFEEVTPAALLDDRACENGTRDFLVQWPDGSEDSWVNQLYIAPDVVEDYDTGLEYGSAARVLRMVQRGDEREFLIQWEDGHDDTWEQEDHVPAALIQAFEEQQRQRLLGASSSSGTDGHAADLLHAPAHSLNGGAAGVKNGAGSKEAAAALA